MAWLVYTNLASEPRDLVALPASGGAPYLPHYNVVQVGTRQLLLT